MSTFEQDADGQERHDADGVTVRDSSASTHNYVGASNFESARANRRNRKPTAAFGGTERRPGEPDQGQDIYLIDPIDDNNQDKLFVTSMMVDPEDKREGAANAKQALCKSRNKPSLQSGYNTAQPMSSLRNGPGTTPTGDGAHQTPSKEFEFDNNSEDN